MAAVDPEPSSRLLQTGRSTEAKRTVDQQEPCSTNQSSGTQIADSRVVAQIKLFCNFPPLPFPFFSYAGATSTIASCVACPAENAHASTAAAGKSADPAVSRLRPVHPSRIHTVPAGMRSVTRARAATRARAVGKDITFKTEMDEEAKRAMFPSNYPLAAA